MKAVVQQLLSLTDQLKEIKAGLFMLRQTRLERFKDCWIDSQDVISALSISSRTLQAMRNSGQLKFTYLNGKYFYKVADLEAMLEQNYAAHPKLLFPDEAE